MPKVSVVMPIYNGERFLNESLDSVIAQTFTDYELICIDDGSTDGSLKVLSQYRDRATIIQQANAGQGAARNAGVARAIGQYVAFLDQDDRWYPQKLDRQVAAMDAASDAAVVYSNTDLMDQSGHLTQVGATLAQWVSALISPLGRLIGEGLVLPSSMLVRREVFERVGGFNAQLRGFEDFDLCARLKQVGRFIFLEEPALCYRVHENGFSSKGGISIIRSRERFLLRMQDLYAGHRGKQRIIRSMLADCYSDWGREEIRSGDRRQGRTLLRRSLVHDPTKMRTYLRYLRTWMPETASARLGAKRPRE